MLKKTGRFMLDILSEYYQFSLIPLHQWRITDSNRDIRHADEIKILNKFKKLLKRINPGYKLDSAIKQRLENILSILNVDKLDIRTLNAINLNEVMRLLLQHLESNEFREKQKELDKYKLQKDIEELKEFYERRELEYAIRRLMFEAEFKIFNERLAKDMEISKVRELNAYISELNKEQRIDVLHFVQNSKYVFSELQQFGVLTSEKAKKLSDKADAVDKALQEGKEVGRRELKEVKEIVVEIEFEVQRVKESGELVGEKLERAIGMVMGLQGHLRVINRRAAHIDKCENVLHNLHTLEEGNIDQAKKEVQSELDKMLEERARLLKERKAQKGTLLQENTNKPSESGKSNVP